MIEQTIIIRDGRIYANTTVFDGKKWNFKLHKQDGFIEAFEDDDGYSFPIENENTAMMFRNCMMRTEPIVKLYVVVSSLKITLH
jgi:hypothetical protein